MKRKKIDAVDREPKSTANIHRVMYNGQDCSFITVNGDGFEKLIAILDADSRILWEIRR